MEVGLGCRVGCRVGLFGFATNIAQTDRARTAMESFHGGSFAG